MRPVISTQRRTNSAPANTNTSQSNGNQLIQEIAKFPTLDLFLDRSPLAKPYTNAELNQLLEAERHERLTYQRKVEKKRDKKKGVPTETPSNEGSLLDSDPA